MSLMSEFESLRTTEEFYHPLDAGNFTSRLFMKMMEGEDARQCAKNTQDPEIRRIQDHSHRLMQTKKIRPVLNVGIVTILDVPGIEVHVPSLRILISRRGHKVCERNSWSQLCNCALQFIVAQKGREFRQ